jgi:hypothetical protein
MLKKTSLLLTTLSFAVAMLALSFRPSFATNSNMDCTRETDGTCYETPGACESNSQGGVCGHGTMDRTACCCRAQFTSPC